MNKNTKKEVIEIMLREYADAGCALDYDSTYHLLIAVVLSAQTTDVSVNKVTPELFKLAPEPKDMADLPVEKIEAIIRHIGMYRTKAEKIKQLSEILDTEYDGIVPGDFDELVKLPGVGRKTANVVLSEAFGEQRIAVDTHVFRVANRIGLAKADNVLDTELQLQKAIPHENWTKMHHALIWHGRRVCSARKPDCEHCCLCEICGRNF